MAFKELLDLDANTTVAIGGVNRKTGNKNPTSAEGYYLGSKEVTSTKSKTGKCWVHYLSTSEGNLGIWGKTNMDKRIVRVPAGTMIRITFTGMKPSKNGDMYTYSIALDKDNTIDVEGEGLGLNSHSGSSFGSMDDDDDTTEDYIGGDEGEDEVPTVATLSAEQKKAKVQAILNRNKSKGA